MTYKQFKSLNPKDWHTQPISPVCQVLTGSPRGFCEDPTEKAYPAMGGGWMALCFMHGAKHSEAFHIEQLISDGETFE